MVTADPQVLTEEEARSFGERFLLAADALLHGQPGPMIEAFLFIDAKDTLDIVPFVLNENQLLVHERLFGALTGWGEPFEAVIAKDRQATMSALFQAVGFVSVVNLQNVHVIHVFQDADTGKQLMKRLDLFWDKLDPLILKHDGLEIRKVGDTKGELALEHWENGELVAKSSYLIVSAGAREFGSGIAPNFYIFDEYDLYPDLDLVKRLDAGKGTASKTVRMSTPRGQKQLYHDYFAAKEGRSGAQAIILLSFQNLSNGMRAGHPLSLPRFRDSFGLLPEHRAILDSPEWEERSAFKGREHEFFRWWEWKRDEIRRRLKAEGIHDEERVLGEMEAEHCSNDRDCWLVSGRSPFRREVLREYHALLAEREKVQGPLVYKDVVPGVQLVVLAPPQLGMAYACGMDCAEGRGPGDDAIGLIKDARGNYVAAMLARGNFDLAQMTKALVTLLWQYGEGPWEPVFAPERDGGFGAFAADVAWEMGYRKIWCTPQKPTESNDRYALNAGEHRGWRTQGNKQEMMLRGVANFNNRDTLILIKEFLTAAGAYDPATERHTADVLMAYFITESITDMDHPKGYGLQFASMASKVKGLVPEAIRKAAQGKQQGWDRQAARPFVVRR